MSEPATTAPVERPAFLDDMSCAYADRNKSVLTLTGNTHDLFWCQKLGKFLQIEQLLYQAYSGHFQVLRLDAALGLDFFENTDREALHTLCLRADEIVKLTGDKSAMMGPLKDQLADTRNSPLAGIVLLSKLLEYVTRMKSMKADGIDKKPICCIIPFAGAIFPNGDFNQLAEVDRQRLVTFLNLIESPQFKASGHQIILLADARGEVNSRILALPSVQWIEISLPNDDERRKFMDRFIAADTKKPVEFEEGIDGFVSVTNGFTLNSLHDLMEGARRTATPITRKVALAELNRLLQADLGDIISIKLPDHGLEDIIGYEDVVQQLMELMEEAEDPSTATPGILASGPSGEGKTYICEAVAGACGRIVIVLKGLRDMWFGQTEVKMEKLRLRLKRYNKVLIIVDEADGQFGRVDGANTHETEKRMVTDVLQLMSDLSLQGKVVWILMTSRPQLLAADMVTRCEDQIPVLPLLGDKRQEFVVKLFARKGVPIADADLAKVMELTSRYSPRNFQALVKKAKAKKKTVPATLQVWQASAAVATDRLIQMLYAAKYTSYPVLLPPDLKLLKELDVLDQAVEAARNGTYEEFLKEKMERAARAQTIETLADEAEAALAQVATVPAPAAAESKPADDSTSAGDSAPKAE